MNSVNGLQVAVAAGLGYTAAAPAAQQATCPIPALGAQWTLAGWINPTGARAHTLGAVASSLGALHLYLDNDGYAAVGVPKTATAIHGTTNLRDGRGHHLAATCDGATLRLYADGAPVGSTAAVPSLTGTTLYWGSAVTPGVLTAPATGTLDEVAIYPTALSAERILAHYQAGRLTGGDTKTYGLGYAFAEDYQAEPLTVGANVAVRGTDLFKRLAATRPAKDYAAGALGTRLHDLLNTLQWSPDSRAIDAGQVTLPAVTLTDAPLAHLDAPVRAERGLLFIAGDGAPTFHDRHHRLNARSRWTFGAGGLPVRRVWPAYSDAGLYNRVSVTRSGGAEQVASDETTWETHDVRTYTLDQAAADLLVGDGQALSWAQWLLAERKDPLARIRAIELDPQYSDALMWAALNAEIGDCITIAHNVPGTKGLTGSEFFVEQISHAWQAHSGAEPPHLVTWSLSKNPRPIVTHRYLRIGSGRIGERIAL